MQEVFVTGCIPQISRLLFCFPQRLVGSTFLLLLLKLEFLGLAKWILPGGEQPSNLPGIVLWKGDKLLHMRANVARMPSNCNLQSYSCFSHQLSLSTVRSKAVQSCLILSTCYEWKIYTFYNSTGQVVSTRQIELSSQNAWLWFTQASASKVV